LNQQKNKPILGFNKINENNDINYYVKLKDSSFPAKFQYTSKN